MDKPALTAWDSAIIGIMGQAEAEVFKSLLKLYLLLLLRRDVLHYSAFSPLMSLPFSQIRLK